MTAEKLNGLSREIIAASIEVHNALGCGLVESIYRRALAIELRSRGFFVEEEVPIPVSYKGEDLGIGFRADLRVEKCVLVECKAVEAIHPIHVQQLRSYLCLLNHQLGLVINFHERLLTDGVKRVVNNFPDAKPN